MVCTNKKELSKFSKLCIQLTANCCNSTSMPSSSPNNFLFSGVFCRSIDRISVAYSLLPSNGTFNLSRFRIHCMKPCLATSIHSSGLNSVIFSTIPEKNITRFNQSIRFLLRYTTHTKAALEIKEMYVIIHI